jgi:hypothetical protein
VKQKVEEMKKIAKSLGKKNRPFFWRLPTGDDGRYSFPVCHMQIEDLHPKSKKEI